MNGLLGRSASVSNGTASGIVASAQGLFTAAQGQIQNAAVDAQGLADAQAALRLARQPINVLQRYAVVRNAAFCQTLPAETLPVPVQASPLHGHLCVYSEVSGQRTQRIAPEVFLGAIREQHERLRCHIECHVNAYE